MLQTAANCNALSYTSRGYEVKFMHISDFDYELPADLIAQFPAEERSSSRLLHVDGRVQKDRQIRDLPSLLQPGDVLVFNNTKVIKARAFGQKASGGRVEILVERVVSEFECLAQIRTSHTPKAGGEFFLDADVPVPVTVLGREGAMFHLRFESGESVLDVLARIGHLPLPPYIQRPDNEEDESRYQTVYASQLGAVAAPTAGLHFDEALLAEIDAMGVIRAEVTLHVGAGTFLPVRVENIKDHTMHSEHYTIPQSTVDAIATARANGNRVMAVGTTTLRALESAAVSGELVAGQAETSIFITPGFHFNVVDRLLTNFHLPKSTLMMLVSAFGGYYHLRDAYSHAVQNRYRFFSYGDAMLLERDHGD